MNHPAHPENVLHIKNMVCNRCIMAIETQLKRLGLEPVSIELGTVVLAGEVTESVCQAVKEAIEPLGFELIDDKRQQTAELIKSAVIELVHHTTGERKANLSDYLSGKLHRDYSYLSKLFSETTGTTIEKYVIAQKIERAKELLAYDELTLNEIADELGYSSAAYLSTQFKSLTGLTPSLFKKQKKQKRKPLDEI